MPELPEVEYTARQLKASILGATIQEALIFWSRTIGHSGPEDFQAHVAGRQIIDVRRRGKFLLIDLSGQLFLSVHRRMTGNFLLLPPGWSIDTSLREQDPSLWSTRGPTITVPSTDPDVPTVKTTHCRLCFVLDDGRCLLFTDPRKFGRIELWSRDQEQFAFARLGPEPLSSDFTVEGFTTALARKRGGIKQALLDQSVVVGVGNIYADEALYYARLHPLRSVESLNQDEISLLHEAIVHVLTLGIERGGTSFSDYHGLWGEAGDNFNHVLVYQQDGKPCRSCGTLIERMVIAQRSSHFCPVCQPLNIVSKVLIP